MSQKKVKQMRRQIKKQRAAFQKDFIDSIKNMPLRQRLHIAILIIFRRKNERHS